MRDTRTLAEKQAERDAIQVNAAKIILGKATLDEQSIGVQWARAVMKRLVPGAGTGGAQ